LVYSKVITFAKLAQSRKVVLTKNCNWIKEGVSSIVSFNHKLIHNLVSEFWNHRSVAAKN